MRKPGLLAVLYLAAAPLFGSPQTPPDPKGGAGKEAPAQAPPKDSGAPARDPGPPGQDSPKDSSPAKAGTAVLLPTPGAPVVETISAAVQGAVRYPAGEGAAAGSLQAGSTPVPIGDVLFIRFAEKKVSAGEALLFLRGGDELFAAIVGGDESEVQVRAYAASPPGGDGTFRIPLEALRGIGFPRRFKDEGSGVAEIHRWLSGPAKAEAHPPPAAERSKAGAAPGEDRLLLVEGAELSGVLKKLDSQGVQFQSGSAGEVRLPLAKVRAVSLAAILEGKNEKKDTERKDTERKDTEKKDTGKAAPPEAVVQFQDGSGLGGRLVALGGSSSPGAASKGGEPAGPEAGLTEGSLVMETPVLGAISAPLDRVRNLSFRGGRCQFLSDLEPAKVTYREDPFHRIEMRRDSAATGFIAPGLPIRIRGREFKKGIGMHSYCRADYALGGGYSRFQAVIGMDDSASPETADRQVEKVAGIAVFRLHVDGRVVFEKQLSWSDPPCPVEIPLEAAQVLGLELDYGPGFLILGRGDWADARIIKKS